MIKFGDNDQNLVIIIELIYLMIKLGDKWSN